MFGPGWKWARGRGTKQLPIVICATIAIGTAIAGSVHAPIFDAARGALSDWTAPALGTLRGPLTAVQGWAGAFGSIFTVYSDNAELRRENAELHKWQQVALALEDRLRGYQQMLNAVPDEKTSFITARVIGESSRPFVRTLILNAGSAQKVSKGQAVVDERGLLGRIYVTGENTSWVILLTDLNSRVPVVIEPSHRRAILVGDNTPAPQLELDVGEGPVRFDGVRHLLRTTPRGPATRRAGRSGPSARARRPGRGTAPTPHQDARRVPAMSPTGPA